VFLEEDTGGQYRAGRHLLAHGCPVRAIVAAFGVKAETVRTWAAEAGVHGEQVHRHLVLGACWSLLHGHADEMRVRMQKGMVP
jgi:hypothetical protein